MTGIAIVGMACLYPDANSPAQLWENVLARRRAFRRMPPERLRLSDYFSPDKNAADRMCATEAALIADYEFDRLQFRVGRGTFQSTDLTHWLALDVAARALADAGFAEGASLPRESTGVLVGNTLTGEFSRASVMRLRWPYVRRVVGERLAAQGWAPELRERFLHDLEGRYKAPFAPVTEETLAGGLSNTIAGRICNHFDLGGGGFTVDGACSSSLLAVAKACSALVAGDLDAAVVGGVDLSLDPFELVGFAKTGALAPGEMRVFDARSAGFWPGEGCGFVVLLREEDARARGLRTYAVIRGWGISSDGSGGLTRPESAGQMLALRRAYARAGFDVASVPLFEGHGTGTRVGDEVELRTLAATRQGGEAVPAVVGSVKGNIGHTKAAAGVAGLIKATLALHHRVLPPAAGVEAPHPVLTESGGMLRVLTRGEAWPAELPVRAGVSAMGFGGINVHVALEGAGRVSRVQEALALRGGGTQDAELILLGGQDRPDLLRQVEQLAEAATWASRAELTDLACTMARSLQARQVRAAVVAVSPAELRARLDLLRQWLEQGETDRLDIQAGVFLGSRATAPRIAYLFPGQGAPVHTEAGAVGQQFPEAQAVYGMVSLPNDRSDTALAQPAIVAASVTGLRALRALGLEAGLAIGHSLGELTALHWAGALDEQAVLDLALARGAIMADAAGPAGAMASIGAGPAALDELLSGTTAVIACYNAPGQTVVAGEVTAVEKVMARARARGLSVARLPVSHAFHSPLVQGAATALSAPLARVAFGPVGRPVISTVTAAPVEPGVDLRALLERQVAGPVRFVEAMEAAAGRADLFIEVGPGRILSTLAGEIGSVPAVPLEAGSASFAGLLRVAGAAFAAGAPVQVEALFAGRFHRPFDPARRPRFFVNPCELAPEGDAPVEPTADAEGPSPAADEATQTAEAYGDVLALVRRLVAEWTDLPVDAIADDARLLQDLHLNSLSVGQLVARAARQLGLGPSAAPTEYAGATVAGLAQALFDLRRTGGGASSPDVARLAPGVDAWVHPFTVDLVERPLPRRRTLQGEATGWEVLASPGHPLQPALMEAFRELEGGGVVLCLPPESDERHVPLLLAGARALLRREKPDRFVLVQHGGGGAAFARTVHLELPGVTTTVVDVPVNHPQAVSWVLAEVSAATGYTEAHYDSQGARRQPFLRLLSDAPDQTATLPLTANDVLLVTGGGKGIGAECALAAARRTGARLVLLGRARPESDRELTANLERFAAAGVAFRYTVADVADPEAVARAVQEAKEHFGPVTAVLHAAGTNAPEPLQNLSEAAFQRTVAIKVGGLRHVLAAVNPTRLRLLVTFGSVIARTGMRGEADYAVANEWLVRLTEQWQAENPHCRCVALEWSVWSGVGMGERLGRVDALAREGITPILPDQGVALFESLIARTVPAVAVVITGRLGDVPTVRWEPQELPLLRFLEQPRAHYPGVELVAEAELSPATDPYLAEHMVEGQSLFPAVMGLEAMTQAAMALAGRSGIPVLESVQFAHPIVVPDGAEAVTVRVAALIRAPGLIEVVLRSSETGFGLDHFRAVARFETPDHSDQLPVAETTPDPVERPTLAPDDLYGSLLFQTGRFRRLLGYRRLLATACTAEISRSAPEGWFGPYLPAELRLGDPGARDACLHSVQACVPDATLLPVAVQKLVITRTDAGPCLLHAVERHQEGETFTYDLTVQSPDGQVLERWEGLTFRRVKTGLANHNWAPALLGTHAQRHLHQLLPGWPVTVAVEQGQGGEARQARSDRAIQRALGRAIVIRRRPDGRPEAEGAPPVSAAHVGALTLAIAGPGPLGCDMERVTVRTEAAWHDLLGPGRLNVAQLAAARSCDDKDTAATRIWAATESLKKAGAPYHTPLLLAEAPGSGWVTFSAGRFRVATWAATLQDGTRLVLAFAKGDADALV